jgi:hypothetical protein
VLGGCGVSSQKLQQAQEKINTLKEKGVPDSSLARAQVFLYQARRAKEKGNSGHARKSADSLFTTLEEIENTYDTRIKNSKAQLDSLRSIIESAKANLSGLRENVLDSMVAVADSFATIEWYLQAANHYRHAISRLAMLDSCERRGEELKDEITGKWVCRQVTKSKVHKQVHAVQTKTFHFYRDGSAKFINEKKGQSSKNLKEDWQFISYGKYDCMCDTIRLLVNRFKITRQNFWERKEDGWKKDAKPTYDSTITDGSQDRWLVYKDLKMDFDRVQKY